MSKDVTIMGLGVFVALLPFLGFPNSWDRVLFLLAGVVLIAVGIVIRRGKKRPIRGEKQNLSLFSQKSVEGAHSREHAETS